MKVFVSSTVYDLLDARAEVAALLGSIGITPVLSDDKLSGFDTAHAANAIETCLINVANCDEVVVMLDQRYGPRLGKFGFRDVSATHLEYERAKDLKKPIHFFVRDRLEADFTTWKKNRRDAALSLPWVDQKDFGLFELLDQHRKLGESDQKNWLSFFTNTIDLKQGIRKILEPRVKPARLIESIAQQQFPILDMDHEAGVLSSTSGAVAKITIRAANCGGGVAFNFSWILESDPKSAAARAVLAPGQQYQRVLTAPLFIDRPVYSDILRIEYDSVIGVKVRESHRVEWWFRDGGILGGVSPIEKTYHNSPEIRFVISD